MDQQRAAHALAAVETILRECRDSQKHSVFRSAARSLPAHLMIQGLGQALAVLRGEKDDTPQRRLYSILQQWLVRPGGPYAGENDALTAITKQDQDRYIVAQAEAVKLAGWLKKFAAALIPAPADKATKQESPRQNALRAENSVSKGTPT
jgi:CRISPR type III-B/RAMP module-associated protein Cmr5